MTTNHDLEHTAEQLRKDELRLWEKLYLEIDELKRLIGIEKRKAAKGQKND